MKNILLIALLTLAIITQSSAQSSQIAQAGQYLEKIGAQFENIRAQQLSYQSAVAHSKKKRQIEEERRELNKAQLVAKSVISKMSCFENDCALRDTILYCLDISYKAYKEEYDKIIDMEEQAEKSYDVMELMMNIQDEVDRKLNEAYDAYGKEWEGFANKYGIQILEDKSKEAKKSHSNAETNDYLNKIFLKNYRIRVQENVFFDALSTKDVATMQLCINSINENIEKTMEEIKTIPDHKNDPSVKNAYIKTLENSKTNATTNFPKIVQFFLASENFTKIKAAFDNKKKSERTQKDVDEYNNALQQYNNGIAEYNTLQSNAVNNTNKINDKLEETIRLFMKKHIAVYKD